VGQGEVNRGFFESGIIHYKNDWPGMFRSIMAGLHPGNEFLHKYNGRSNLGASSLVSRF